MKERFDNRLPDPPASGPSPKEAVRADERMRQGFFRQIRESVFARRPAVKAVFFAYGLGVSALKSDRVDQGSPDARPGQEEREALGRRERLEAYFGRDLLAELVDISDRLPREKERGVRSAALEGFEESLGIRHETVEALLNEGYPRGFAASDAVERIRYSTERIPMPERYGIPGYEEGHCTVSRGHRASEIVLTADGLPVRVLTSADFQVRRSFGRLLSHELAHASDWQMAADLAPDERLALLDRVVARVESPDAIPYEYVARIRNPNHDLHAQRLDRAREYFAELIQDAFAVPAKYFSTFPTDTAIAAGLAERHGGPATQYLEDARLVTAHIKRLDPRFHWLRGAAARERALEALAHERAQALVVQACRSLEVPELADGLISVFEANQHDLVESTDWEPSRQETGLETGRLLSDWNGLLRLVVRGRFDPRLPVRNDHVVLLSLVQSINHQLDGLRHEQAIIEQFREEALRSLASLEL